LLNWYLKQFKTSEDAEEEVEETENVAEEKIDSFLETENNDLNIISSEIDNLKNFENDLEANLNCLEKELNINNDDFFNKLETDIKTDIKAEINEPVNGNIVSENIVSETVVKEKVDEDADEDADEDEDDFIKNLIKEREKDLNLVQKINKSSSNSSVIVENETQVQFNLNDDIKNAKNLIAENNVSSSVENYNDIEINDNILDIIQNQRTQEVKKNEIKKSEVKRQEPTKSEPLKSILKNNSPVQNNNIQKYPPQMRDNPIWKLLFKIINEPKPIDNFMGLMSKLSINEYPKVCTFIYFVEELENKLEMKVQLIMGLIFIYNNFVKLVNMRQFVYNGMNLLQVVNLMNNWKLNETLINTKKKLELSKNKK
jgi:hypothetical protein